MENEEVKNEEIVNQEVENTETTIQEENKVNAVFAIAVSIIEFF